MKRNNFEKIAKYKFFYIKKLVINDDLKVRRRKERKIGEKIKIKINKRTSLFLQSILVRLRHCFYFASFFQKTFFSLRISHFFLCEFSSGEFRTCRALFIPSLESQIIPRRSKSVFPSNKIHRRPSSTFFVFDEKQILCILLTMHFRLLWEINEHHHIHIWPK